MPIETLNINDIKSLYYTANLENLSSILEKGILARSVILKTEFYKKQHDISNEEVQNIRSNKNFMSPRTGKKRKLHEFANLYIQPNNAFLVVIQKETSREQLCVIRIKNDILKDRQNDAVVTSKNAACHRAKFFAPKDWAPSPDTSQALVAPRLSGLPSTKWVGSTKFGAAKQSRQSEVLIPEKVEPRYFDCIFVHNETVQKTVSDLLANLKVSLPVLIHPSLFTSPRRGAFSKSLISQHDPNNPARLASETHADTGAPLARSLSEDFAFCASSDLDDEQRKKQFRPC